MAIVAFLLNSAFLFSLLLVNSNKMLLLASLVYLIILIKKTQNYRFSLFLLLINLLPFTIGRNLIETTITSRSEIFSFAIYDVKYFLPIYLSDLFLILIYQNYFSKKFFSENSQHQENRVSKATKISVISLIVFLFLVAIRSINHEFSSLLIYGSLIIVKFILLFGLSNIVSFKNKNDIKTFYQTIASITFFQAIIVFIEQFKGGNIGKFIENRLPGLELGTRSSEAIDLLRADGTFNEPNITAIFLLMNAVLLTSAALQEFKLTKNKNYLYFLVSLSSLLAIIFTGSRSLYVIALVPIIFFFFKYKNLILKVGQNLLETKVFKVIILIFVIVGIPYLLVRTSSLKNVLSTDGSLSYRKELNQHVLSMSFKDYLGIGLDLTPYYLAKNFKTVDSPIVIFDQAPAHNIIVQILAETGIFACIVFLFFIYYSFRIALITKNQGFALAAITYFLAAQFHPVFTNHYELTAFFFLYLGIGINEA